MTKTEKKERITGWLNVYMDGAMFRFSTPHKTKELARRAALRSCIGQIFIDSELLPHELI